MREGILRKDCDGHELTATAGPSGWRSDDPEFARLLAESFPKPDTEVGTPWVQAFWEAVRALGAQVVQEPEPEPYNPFGREGPMPDEFLPSIFTHPVGTPEGLLGDAVDEETFRRHQQGAGNKFVDTSADHWQFGPPAQGGGQEVPRPDAEYSRLSRQVDELAETRGVDSPEYQEAFRRLLEAQRRLGLENDPGLEEETPQQ
jgi:hypothetical protein